MIIDGLILKNYESATGEFNYAEDACEFIRPGRPVLEKEEARRWFVDGYIYTTRYGYRIAHKSAYIIQGVRPITNRQP